MKRILLLFGVFIFLSACSDVEAYEKNISTLENEVQELTTSLEASEKDREELNTEIDMLIEENDQIKDSFDKYKERMNPYEELEESEAQARKIEADKIAAKEKEAAEIKKAEEEALNKAKQEAKEKEQAEKEAAAKKSEEEELARGYETGITYDQLARTPDDYIGEKIKFSGKVIQVIEGTDEIQLRFAVNDDYDQVMYIGYSPDIVDQRVLEDDYLTIYGNSIGTISYESTMGGTITIPASVVEVIEFK